MARLAVAQTQLSGSSELVAEALVNFIDPDEDGDGAERLEAIDSAMMGCHAAASALSVARSALSEMSDEEMAVAEPDDLDDDEDPDAGDDADADADGDPATGE